MQLEQWAVENYRSVKNESFQLSGLDILVGRNNSGKSNVLDSLQDYQSILHGTSITDNWLDRRLMARPACTTVTFGATYSTTENERSDILDVIEDDALSEFVTNRTEYTLTFTHRIAVDEFKTRSEIEIHTTTGDDLHFYECVYKRDIDTIELTTPTVSGGEFELAVETINATADFDSFDIDMDSSIEKNAEELFLPSSIKSVLYSHISKWKFVDSFRKAQDTMSLRINETLAEDGQNLAQVLNTLAQNRPEAFAEIDRLYADIMEGVSELRAPLVGEDHSPDTTVKIKEQEYNRLFPLELISSGSKEILILITKIVLADDGCTLLVVEEPELHLHPDAQRELFEKLQEVADEETQTIVSTHSDIFVEQSEAGAVLAVTRDMNEASVTDIERIDDDSVDEHLSQMGFSRGDILQSSAVVFVDGVSDQSVLKTFSKKLGTPVSETGVTLVPSRGDELFDHGPDVMDVLDRMRVPYMVVADSDGDAVEAVEQTYRDQLSIGPHKLHVLEREEIESYLLTPPRPIASFLDTEEVNIRQYTEGTTLNKGTVDELFREYCTQGRYNERHHAGLIAEHFDADEIDDEISGLVERINGLGE